jgi:murein DD-endopeptidase MepM/ murein hydrolase activator NlpD
MDMDVRCGVLNPFLRVLALGFILSSGLLAAEETVHIVQRDETIYSIARSFGVPMADLMQLNGITDPTRLQAGRRLRIPEKPRQSSAQSEAPAFTEYRVVKNDTFYSIARRFGVSVDILLETNGFSKGALLREGAILHIPREGLAPAVSPATAVAAAPSPVSAASQPAAEAAAKPVPVTGQPGAVSPPATVPPAQPAVPEPPSLARTVLPGADTDSGGEDPEDPRVMVTKTVDASVRWPVSAKEVSYMTGKLNGVALVGERAEPVKSLTQGTVVSAGPYRGFGRVAIVQVAGGYLYVYGGCESLTVKEGDRVAPGTELGKLGIDAVSKKPQLFFLVYQSNTPIDPAKAPRT